MKILKIRDVKTPLRAHSTDAGIDLYVPNDFLPKTLKSGESAFIPSGIKMDVPIGHAIIAFNKSGVASKKNFLIGACVIDEGYQGEVHIDIKNVGKASQLINPGDKIIQVLCVPVNYVDVEEVHDEDELYGGVVTDRGEGKTGSTGIN